MRSSFSQPTTIIPVESLSIERCQQLASLHSLQQLKHLRYLNLTECQNDLKFNILDNLGPDLDVLELNNISNCQTRLLRIKHSNLKSLKITQFGCTIFRTHFISKISKLSQLNISKNQLKSIEFDSNLSEIESLDLSENQLGGIDFGTKLTNLKSLDLSNNSGVQIKTKSFEGLKSLEKLYLANLSSYVTRLDTSFIRLAGLSKLTVLDLKRNRIVSLDKDLFKSLPALDRLDLSENTIDLKSTDFSYAKCLRFLDLSRNDLNVLEPRGFVGLESVEVLNLGFNLIGNLEACWFEGLGGLRKLSLRYNKLESVPDEELVGVMVGVKVDLRNNPIADNSWPASSKTCLIC